MGQIARDGFSKGKSEAEVLRDVSHRGTPQEWELAIKEFRQTAPKLIDTNNPKMNSINLMVLMNRAANRNLSQGIPKEWIAKKDDNRFNIVVLAGSVVGIAVVYLYQRSEEKRKATIADYYTQLYEPRKRRLAKGLLAQDIILRTFDE